MVFGWGFNVRECKLACIQGVNRIKMFRNKKMNEMAGERRVVADHINKGNSEMGMMRVEQVMRLRNTLKAVEILELFLEMIKTRLDYLSKQKEIPSEMRTPLLSIAFASTRLTDIPELAGIRKSLESRFGRDAFAEVTKGDPGPASGVQENLLFCLSVLPPSVPAKVEAAMEIMTELGTLEKDPEDLRADLEKASGMFAPRPSWNNQGSSTGGGSAGGGLDGGWLPATIPAPAPNIPVMDPTPVNDYGNPAPSYQALSEDPKPFPPAGGIPAPAPVPAPTADATNATPAQPTAAQPAAPTAPAAAPPTQPTRAASPPGVAAAPTATVPPPLPAEPPTQAIDSESYTGAMQAAMAGATPADSTAPVLDSTNAGTEAYPGAFVMGSEGRAGSMPTPPPGAYNKTGTTASDLMFPDAKWSDTPPNYSLEGSLGALPAAPPPAAHDSFPTPPAGGGFELPAAPSHDPEMPSAPKFSHTGVVYETSVDEPDKSDQVQDDLLERFKRLNR